MHHDAFVTLRYIRNQSYSVLRSLAAGFQSCWLDFSLVNFGAHWILLALISTATACSS